MSLRTIFNRAATPPYLPKEPIILVSTVGDDPTRGDSHAYIGIARLVAEKLGGHYHYVDDKILAAKYPEQKRSDLEESTIFQLYAEEIGNPDILFEAHRHSWQTPGGKNPFHVRQFNEVLTNTLSTERELVAHHITPGLLQEEGARFREAYPEMPPLIAVMVADNRLSGTLSEMLVSRLNDTEKAGIFICTNRRVSTKNYEAMMADMSFHLEENNLTDRISLLGYDFHTGQQQKAYNPYMGLLNQADHIVVIGNSRSMVSEALASGKSVYLHDNCDIYNRLEKQGLVKHFNARAKGEKLCTEAVKVVNPTETVADAIVQQYRRKYQEKLGCFSRALAYLMDG